MDGRVGKVERERERELDIEIDGNERQESGMCDDFK